MINALTIDLDEPYFATQIQGKAVRALYTDKFRESMMDIMEFLDKYQVKGTFFVQGIVAAHYPEIIYELHQRGHRIGIHSYEHRNLETISMDEYRFELERSIVAVESVTGKKILSHRAPQWSIITSTLWALDILEELGIIYDSSIYPMETQLFGMRGIPSHPFKVKNSRIIEFPPGVVQFSGFAVPFSGGAYLNTLPMSVIRLGYKKMHSEGYPALLYVHPWETELMENPSCQPMKEIRQMKEKMKDILERMEKILMEYSFTTLEESLAPLKDLPEINIHKYKV